jgi:hypothetical protein
LREAREKAFMQWAQMEGRMPHRVCQRRPVEMDALAGIDLGLPAERQMIGIFGHENLSNGDYGRQAALDQPGRRLGLHDTILAGTTGVFGTPGNHNAELGRHYVQSLAFVFTDPMQFALAAGASLVVDVDDNLDPRQMRRQCPAIDAPLGLPELSRLDRLPYRLRPVGRPRGQGTSALRGASRPSGQSGGVAIL